MKVEKVEIKTEMLDIPDDRGRMDFAVIPPISVAMYRNTGEIPEDNLTAQKVTYEVRHSRYGRTHKTFLVKLDDREIFNDLFDISNDTFDKAVLEKTADYQSQVKRAQDLAIQGIEEAQWRVTSRIKNLSWWKRLFKQF